MDKNRTYDEILDTAHQISRSEPPAPIKCVEACFLAMLLTDDLSFLTRIPLSFSAQDRNGECVKHLVLAALHSDGSAGALGLSREPELMYKPLRFKGLSALAFDFK